MTVSIQEDIINIIKHTGSRTTAAKLAEEWDIKDWNEFDFYVQTAGAPSKVSAKAKYLLLLKFVHGNDIFFEILDGDHDVLAKEAKDASNYKMSNTDLLTPHLEAVYQKRYEELYAILKESDPTRLPRYILYRNFPYDKTAKVNKYYKPETATNLIIEITDGDKEYPVDKEEHPKIDAKDQVDLDKIDEIPVNSECLGMVFAFAGQDLAGPRDAPFTHDILATIATSHGGSVTQNVDRATILISSQATLDQTIPSKKVQAAVVAGLPIVTADYLIDLAERKKKGIQLRNPVNAKSYLLGKSQFGKFVYTGASVQKKFVPPPVKKTEKPDEITTKMDKLKVTSSNRTPIKSKPKTSNK